MSAILGVFNLNGKPVKEESLRPAMDIVAHYGGDGSGVWTCGPVGFGHQMFRITPESRDEHMPSTCGSLTITADARLDNRDELFDELGVSQHERAKMPDSALILRAYRKWGDDCPKHFVGDYAFAIWDDDTKSLFCARDHIGAKPFYYFHTSEAFIFASDIRAVLSFEGVRAEIDEAEIARMLLHQHHTYYDAEHTFFKNIYRLPFAHTITVTRDGLRKTCYWRPEDVPEVSLPTLDDYADRLLELVDRAVSDTLRANVPVGSHLSGGLDSSSVSVLAARHLRERGSSPPVVFSWSPPPDERPEDTEHRRILPICEQEGLSPIFLERDRQSELKAYQIDISVKPALTVRSETMTQEDAQREGVRLMLSGWGGDETVSFNGRGLASGYFVNRQWRMLAEYSRLGYALKHPARIPGTALRLWDKAVLPTLPDGMYHSLAYRARRMRNQRVSYINPDFEARMRSLIRPVGKIAREVPGVKANQHILYYNGHMTARMESWASFGADRGISYAFPLTNRRVMEFGYGLPDWVHYQDTWARYLYRYTMARILPPNTTWDSVKVDGTLNRRVLKRKSDEERAELNRWLEENRLGEPNPWIDIPKLREALLSDVDTPRKSGGAEIAKAMQCLTIWHNWRK